eukprot:GHVU01066415.1.p1 GENE.GHVU01066415.1~~GHVU01066415.1.p1  ORF type:complete len:101 (+),score=5.66 GHVU01066415.1:255-557(+)
MKNSLAKTQVVSYTRQNKTSGKLISKIEEFFVFSNCRLEKYQHAFIYFAGSQAIITSTRDLRTARIKVSVSTTAASSQYSRDVLSILRLWRITHPAYDTS